MDFIKHFNALYNKNIKGARFKIGDKVTYHHILTLGEERWDKEGTGIITGVNKGDENTFEYSCSGINCLLWQSEIYKT